MAAIGTRKLTIEIDGTAYAAETSDVRITSAAGDDEALTWAEAAGDGNAGRLYALAVKLNQDAAAGTLWTEIFDNSGTDVAYTVAPYGNAIPSVSEPHFTGTCTITEPDGDLLGGTANRSNTARLQIEVVFACTGKPVKVTAP